MWRVISPVTWDISVLHWNKTGLPMESTLRNNQHKIIKAFEAIIQVTHLSLMWPLSMWYLNHNLVCKLIFHMHATWQFPSSLHQFYSKHYYINKTNLEATYYICGVLNQYTLFRPLVFWTLHYCTRDQVLYSSDIMSKIITL